MEPNKPQASNDALAKVNATSTTSQRNTAFRFTAEQRLALEKLYHEAVKPGKPTKEQRQALADEFGVRLKSVDNWYETRRRRHNNPGGPPAGNAARARARESDDEDDEVDEPASKKVKLVKDDDDDDGKKADDNNAV